MGKKSSSSCSSKKPSGKIDTEFKSVSIFVNSAKNLRNVETFGKLDPYVVIRVGDERVQAPVFNDAGCNPTFNLQFKFRYLGSKTMILCVKDKKKMASDKVCGECCFDFLEQEAHKRSLTHHKVLLNYKGKSAGEVDVSIRFHKDPVTGSSVARMTPEKLKDEEKKIEVSHPYKSVSLAIFKARNLRKVESKIDPYVAVTLGPHTLKTEAKKSAGTDPTIDTIFLFPYANERKLAVNFFDEDKGPDRPVGSAKIDLAPFIINDALHHGGGGRVTLALTGPDSVWGSAMDCKVKFLKTSCDKATWMAKPPKDKSSSSSSSS